MNEPSDYTHSTEPGANADNISLDLDVNNPDHAFAILEKNFNKTLADMEQDLNATQYAEEYNKLFEALYQARIESLDLQDKFKFLETELSVKAHQLEVALQLAEADKNTIEELKSQINTSWKMADTAHSREQLAQEVIDNLRRQIDALNAEIDFRNKMNQDIEGDALAEKKQEGLERDKERLLGEVHTLNQKLTNALSYQEELERKNSATDMKLNLASVQLEEQENEIENLKALRAKLENDIEEFNQKFDDKDQIISELQNTIRAHKKELTTLDNAMKESKVFADKTARDLDQINTKFFKLSEEYDKQAAHLLSTKKKLEKKMSELRCAEDECNKLKNDTARVMKNRDQIEKKLNATESERDEIIFDRNNLRQRIAIFEKEIEEYKKMNDEQKRSIEVHLKEKDILNKTVTRQQMVSQEQAILYKLQEQTKKKMEHELDLFFMENNKLNKVIHVISREKDRLAEEQITMKKKIEDFVDDIRLKKATIYDMKKSAAEQLVAYRMQQNMFESVRAEKNTLQKQLQESNSESTELKNRLKITSHQTEQLKEDISMKEQLLIKEENILRKVMKEKENLRIEVDNGLETIRKLKCEIAEMKDEQRRLHKALMENDRTIRQQNKDLEQLMNERDVLGSQLVRRNDEIALQYEKIVILETTLHRGISQYDQRLEDIRLLKIEIKRLRQEKILITKSLNNMVDLKQEVFHLERDLTKAKLKCRALEEEVQNPLNIHRWRKLEGSDPQAMDLLQKTQILQKRLLQQTSEAVERERQLKEAEKLYLNLKALLAKQPGPGIQEQLNKTQRALKGRGNKLKCLISELNMSELQASHYKSDLQKVSDELYQLKKKYLSERKAHQTLKLQFEASRELSATQNRSRTTNQQNIKFTGGGFRMSLSGVHNNN